MPVSYPPENPIFKRTNTMIDSMDQLVDKLRFNGGNLFLEEIKSEIYHAAPSLSQSELKLIADKTPRHFHHMKKSPRPPSDEMKLGSAAHMAILEPDKFIDTYRMLQPINKRTKAGREEVKALEEKAREEKKIYLIEDQYRYAEAIAYEMGRHPIARDLLSNGVAERASFTELHGEAARILTDYYRPSDHEIIDVKTTKCASLNEFERDLRKYRYHWQACWYSDVVEKLTGAMPTFKIIAIENVPPHCIAIYEIRFDLMSIARREIMGAIEKLRVAERSGWDGYPLGTQELGAHHWEWERYKDRFQDAIG